MIARKSDIRRAMSLVEILVVLAIIGILVGLLLVAIQRVRMSAARTNCLSHLRQIGLGLQSFHDTRQRLPSGFRYDEGKAALLYASWQIALLPYVEQEAVHKIALADYTRQRNPARPIPHAGYSTFIPVYVCPLDARIRQPVYVAEQRLTVAFTSYLGVCGTDCFKPDGVMYRDSRTTFGSISDGLSNTLAVGERPPSPDLTRGWWYAGYGQGKTGSTDLVLGAKEPCEEEYRNCAQRIYEFSPGRIDNPCDIYHFWSQHGSGSHFLMCDGSVRMVNYSARTILPALATRAGSEAVSE